MLHTLRCSLQNAVYFIMVSSFVPVLFTFYIQGVLKFKCKTPMPKVKSMEQRPSSELKSPKLIKKYPHFKEKTCSVPHSHQPLPSPYPAPDQSSLCHCIPLLEDLFNIIFPSTPKSSNWSFSFRCPTHPKHVCSSPVFHTFRMPRPSHSSSFDHFL
jgi:hypothetical protein